jgi:catechol 2,3-dioxygenase-like lactoylglutathione lyase family enzyme
MRFRFPCTARALVCTALTSLSMAQSVPLSGVAHVALRVNNLEQSRAFYKKLGFEQAFEFSEGDKVIQSFLKINDRQFIELYPRTKEDQEVGLMHVCYESTDISVLKDMLAKRGADPTGIKKARAGNLLFVLHDPENELVEYTQYMPGSLHSEDRGKHLGLHRVSDHLRSVVIPVRNVVPERDFYITKLGFSGGQIAGRKPSLGIPGSRDTVELETTGTNTTELRFAVGNLRKAEAELRRAGFDPKKRPGVLAVADPDGNGIVFERK